MKKVNLIGISKDEKYLFTNKGFYVCENEGFYVPYNENMIPYLIQISKDNNNFEFGVGEITLNEYISKPRKILTIISEILSPQHSLKLIKEWEENFGDKLFMINESTDSIIIEQRVQESWDGLKILLESWLGDVWDKTKQAASKVGGWILSGLSAATKKIILPIIKQGIIPLLRWIRRNAYTAIGIVVDVVTAIIPYTTSANKTIWGLIVLLGLYEIASGDIDPKDPDRVSNPYMFLIIDLISFIFAAAVGQTAKVGLKASSKTISSSTSKILKSLLNKLPGVRNGLKSITDIVSKNLPGLYKVVEVVFRGLDKIILGVETFIRQLLTKKGAVAVATGVSIAWFFEPRNLKIGDSGNDVAAVNNYFSENHNNLWPECPLSQSVVNSIKQDGNKFTKNTEDAVKMFEGCLIKHSVYGKDAIKKVDGQITDAELALYTNIEMDDRNIVTKFIPHSTKQAFQNTIGSVLTTAAKGLESIIPKGGNQNKGVVSNPVTADNTQRTTNNNTVTNNPVTADNTQRTTNNNPVSITQDIDNIFQN